MATKPREGEAKGLSGRATKKSTFFAASLMQSIVLCYIVYMIALYLDNGGSEGSTDTKDNMENR